MSTPDAHMQDAAERGMVLAVTAADAPGRLAVHSRAGTRTFGELNANANRLARALRAAGLRPGDGISVLCSNRPELAESLYAAFRTGLRFTPINWHLNADEVTYILGDSEAKAFVADARFAGVARAVPAPATRLAVGGVIDGFDRYEDAIAPHSPADIDDAVLGVSMLYTSGTTGRPKGVYRPAVVTPTTVMSTATAGYRPGEDLHLTTGPLYHAAPLLLGFRLPLSLGVGCVVMDGWEAEETLRLVERHRITHTHMVPTMFHRLLQLPEETRRRYDLSSLRYIVHAAAPCPVALKQAMIDWLGPIVHEYYAATEGGGTWVTPEEWLRKPGTVGRPSPGQTLEARDDEGRPVARETVGTIWIKAPDEGRFEYFKDPGKTAATYDGGDFFTLGDMGYFDEDGYLFLTDRTADLIISGGVNVYPAEIDAVLLTHPAVGDVATIGVPNEEWGEEVKAVVELRDGVAPSDALARGLIEHCAGRLARYKCPRTVDFVAHLPREESGKMLKRKLRDPYWAGRERRI